MSPPVPAKNFFGNMDFLTLVVVDFLPEEMKPSEGQMVYPFGEELQEVFAGEVGGER